MINFHVIIPARYHSTRLPKKVLVDIAGQPLIQHVYERSLKSGARSVTIATDDERVKIAAEQFGASVCLTRSTHQSGSERVAEASRKLKFKPNDIVVNVQGDQPLVNPKMIAHVAQSLSRKKVRMATLATPLKPEDLFNPNVVKVLLNKHHEALYFSRAPIPWDRDKFKLIKKGKNHYQFRPAVDSLLAYYHIGLYAYRGSFLRHYLRLSPSPLETIEWAEQLRILWHGEKIYVGLTPETVYPEVNTLEDLKKVRYLIKTLTA